MSLNLGGIIKVWLVLMVILLSTTNAFASDESTVKFYLYDGNVLKSVAVAQDENLSSMTSPGTVRLSFFQYTNFNPFLYYK